MPFTRNILYKPELKEDRKSLRNHSTSAEKALWNILKNKNVEGRKFNHPILRTPLLPRRGDHQIEFS
ncbi:MAG TPA: DUF559 domain-containing protein [Bacteroidales bacterium]|nr:DUF559 domain-containing protein [Bacteroidales bacterium]